MKDLWSERLSEYIDGDLLAGEVRDLEIHLRGCTACTQEIEGLRRVKASLAELPASAPPQHVWLAIHGRLAPGRAGRWRWWIRALAYGAAPAALLAAALTWMLWRGLDPATAPLVTGGSPPPTGASEAAVEYGAAAAAWRAVLLVEIDDPELRQLLASNMRPYDQAIEQTRQAIARDPDDPLLREHLSRLLKAQLQFLRRAGGTVGGLRSTEVDG